MKDIPHAILKNSLSVVTFFFLLFSLTFAQESKNGAADPLAPFARIIGGEWHLQGYCYQVFEWGVGRKSVKSSSYFVKDGKSKLVSDGAWFWHPGEEKIRGYFTAIEMPVVFFDYTTRFENDKMINRMKAYSPDGKEEYYTEIWEFTDDDHYAWTLLKHTPEGQQKVMGGIFERKRN